MQNMVPIFAPKRFSGSKNQNPANTVFSEKGRVRIFKFNA